MAIVTRRGKTRTTYAAVVRVGGRQVWRTFPTLREARRYEAQAVRGSVAPSRMTVADYLRRWLSDCIEGQRAAGTVESYNDIVQRAIGRIGSVRLEKLGPLDLQAHVTALIRETSPATANHHATVLSIALRQAVRWGYLAKNPLEAVTRPQVPPFEPRVMDEEEARLFLARTRRESRYFPVYLAAITTGMRMGELLALTWDRVDLPARRIAVVRSKTAAGRRLVSIPEVLVEVLRRIEGQPAERVFPYSDQQVRYDFRRYAPAGMRFHDLRHSHASHLMGRGIPAKVVSERLGHSGIGITLDLYSHVLPGMERQAAEAADAMFPLANVSSDPREPL